MTDESASTIAMPSLAEQREAALEEIALWAGVEKEWQTPKGDLTAYFMRASARDRREAAEEALAAIDRLEGLAIDHAGPAISA